MKSTTPDGGRRAPAPHRTALKMLIVFYTIGLAGTASLLVPLSSVLAAATGSWHTVFIVASIMNAIAALLAWFVLRPMRRAHMS